MCLFKQQNNEIYVSQEECAVSFFSISEEGLVLCYPHFFLFKCHYQSARKIISKYYLYG